MHWYQSGDQTLSDTNGTVLQVKVALYYKGLSWQTPPVKPCGSQDIDPVFHKKVPLGKIPALLVVQGQEGQAGQQTEVTCYFTRWG